MNALTRALRPLSPSRPIRMVFAFWQDCSTVTSSSSIESTEHNFSSLKRRGKIILSTSSAVKNDACYDKHVNETNETHRGKKQWELEWNMRYEELKEYVAEHGDALVPHIYTTNQSLGYWVNTQRMYFKASQTGNAIMPAERIQKLNEIGFVWDASKFHAQWLEKMQELNDYKWLEMLEELRAYKEINGDTLVPQVYPVNPSLEQWVSNQRRCYRNNIKLKELEEKYRGVDVLDDEVKKELEQLNKLAAGITEERIKLLQAEVFIWDVHAYAWELNFQELQSFIDVNSHAPIMSKKTYDPLAVWVHTQRKNYRTYLKGQHTTMTEERVKRLNSVGFDWKLAQRTSKFF